MSSEKALRDKRLAGVAPEALREYTVKVKYPGGVRVVKVQAISPAHARARAAEKVGVSVEVRA